MNRTLAMQQFPAPLPAPDCLMEGPLASLQQYVTSFESVMAVDCPCRGPAECRMLAHVLEDQLAYIQRQAQAAQQASWQPGKQGELAAWQQLGRRLRLLHAGLTGCACLASCAAPRAQQSCRVG